MIIKRIINGTEIEIELTNEEIFNAHKECIINWMQSECSDLLYDKYDYQTDPITIYEIASMAYEYYSDEKGTEWECCDKAVDEWAKENIEEDK